MRTREGNELDPCAIHHAGAGALAPCLRRLAPRYIGRYRQGASSVVRVHRHVGDRDRGAAQGVPPAPRGPHGRGRRARLSVPEGVRLPRSQRRGQDDHDPLPARAGAAEPGRSRCSAPTSEDGAPQRIGRVGSIVEAPAMFPRFTGRRNLEILARIHGEGEPRSTRRSNGSGCATARRTRSRRTRSG